MPRAPRDWRRWIGLAALAIVAAVFAYLNSGERTAIHLGFTVLYQVPLVGLVFTVYLLGMATMFVLGLRHDLRVRRALRQHALDEAPEYDRPPPPPPYPPDHVP